MSPRPIWLPEIIECGGKWEETLARLYAVFERDFVHGRPHLRDRKILWDQRVSPGESYSEGFWHLISRSEPESGDRIPEFRRSERLCWCRPMLDNTEEPEIKLWDAFTSGKLRTYLWLEDEDFVLVLEKKGPKKAFLITAYHLDGESSRRKLRNSYANRV